MTAPKRAPKPRGNQGIWDAIRSLDARAQRFPRHHRLVAAEVSHDT